MGGPGGRRGGDAAGPALRALHAAAACQGAAAPHRRTLRLAADLALRAAADRDAERGYQCATLRDIFGNPFRPAVFDPRWQTADVTALARGVYEERAFDRLPLLADGLMDAGCDDDQVLGHCRGDGPHVRGCWVVDLVLGKE